MADKSWLPAWFDWDNRRMQAGHAELPAPGLRTERLSTEALSRLATWLYPETVEPTLEDRAMLAMMGIRWP